MLPSGSFDAEALNTTVRLSAPYAKDATGRLFTDDGVVFGCNEARPTTTATITATVTMETTASFWRGLILIPPLKADTDKSVGFKCLLAVRGR